MFFLSSCNSNTDTSPVLARVGKAEITQDEYEKRLRDVTMLAPVDNAPIRQALLQTMIDEEVLLIEADRRGLREQEDFKQRSQAIRMDAALEAYREAIADTKAVAQEEEIKQAFVLANEQVAARHLYAPSLEEANTLYAKLQAGATFEELAPQVFKDYRLASNGGYLGYFKWDEMEPNFTAAAQDLKKGEISKPVRTKHGYSIIKLEDRVRPPILTETEYGVQRKKMKWITAHRKRAREIQKMDAKTFQSLNVQFQDAVITQMFEQIQRDRANSNQLLEEGVLFDALPETAVVAQIAGKNWTMNDFRARAAQTSARQRSRIQTKDDLKDFIGGLALRDEYLRRAKRAGFEKNANVLATIRHQENLFLLEKMTRLLTNSVRMPLDSLRYVYSERPQDYVFPEMARVREITVANQAQSRSMVRQLKNGADFSELAKRYSLRKWSAERGGEVGYVTKADLGQMGDGVFNLKPGEIGGPYQQGEYFSIFEVMERLPARQKTFDEAKAGIEEMLLPIYQQRALRKQLEALRQPLAVDVNQQVLQQVKSPLQAESGGMRPTQ